MTAGRVRGSGGAGMVERDSKTKDRSARPAEGEGMTETKAEPVREVAIVATGPKSIEGKAASSKNALRHGLLSKDAVLPWEDAATLGRFRRALLYELAPVGALEILLADRVISLAWRLRRFAQAESGIFRLGHATPIYADSRTKAYEEACGDGDEGPLTLATTFRDDTAAFLALSRYETTLSRALDRALREFQRLQATRKGQAGLDVVGVATVPA